MSKPQVDDTKSFWIILFVFADPSGQPSFPTRGLYMCTVSHTLTNANYLTLMERILSDKYCNKSLLGFYYQRKALM